MRVFRGIDGCKSGWVCVDAAWDGSTLRVAGATIAPTFAAAISGQFELAAVDIPIGLETEAARGGRAADSAARALLGKVRSSSVFSAPVRPAIDRNTYAEALAASRASSGAEIGLSRQAFAIAPKIREVDDVMTPEMQTRIVETHPELSFMQLAGRPMRLSKKKREGAVAREVALSGAGLSIDQAWRQVLRRNDAKRDDVNDAMACAWTAWRVGVSTACRIPE